MNNKTAVGIFVVIALVLLGLWATNFSPRTEERVVVTQTQDREKVSNESETSTDNGASTTEVAVGTYTIVPEESTLRWSGKKPLIDGYINSGTLDVTAGTIVVTDMAKQGEFTIDMDTLVVSETRKKPGKESLLEEHLKGERWFDVGAFPTATFSIDTVVSRPESVTTHLYDVTGTLTMKGQSGKLTFPATIYQGEDGTVHAEASLEFDRTKWGISAGSSSFFDNLADNAVDDMVALSFDLTAIAK